MGCSFTTGADPGFPAGSGTNPPAGERQYINLDVPKKTLLGSATALIWKPYLRIILSSASFTFEAISYLVFSKLCFGILFLNMKVDDKNNHALLIP